MKAILNRGVLKTVVILIIGIAIGLLWPSSPAGSDQSAHSEHESEEVQSTWTCAMHTQIRQGEPGDCPICGMELIPITKLGDSPLMLEMTDQALKLADIQTSAVETSKPEKLIQLQGKVQVDERNISLITSRYAGRIEKLYVDFKGMEVRAGQKLASIYSPQLVTAQQELFEAIKYKKSNPILYKAARGKLKLWDISDTQIDAIEQNGEPQNHVDILSPLSGVVTKRMATLGAYIKEGTSLFEVVDLSRVWILFDAYESDIPWLNVGDKTEFNVNSIAGESFTGNITFIDPLIDPVTRVASVRVEVDNRDKRLKPEMFATASVFAELPITEAKLMVPKSAIMWTGSRSVVYVLVPDLEQPMFQFREVVAGLDLGTHVIVESGLLEGERVVTNGTFKVDAAAQLAGKRSMMNRNETSSLMGSIQVPEEFRQELTVLVNGYMELKNQLVASDAKNSKEQTKTLSELVRGMEVKKLNSEAKKHWTDYEKIMVNALDAMSVANDIKEQRLHFMHLSAALSNAIEAFGIHGQTVYKDYCPMAVGNEGAYWLSETKEILNPYFGEKMLKCGEIRDVYDGKSMSKAKESMSGHNH